MNARTAAMPPETFVSRVLHEQLKARYIAAGTDLSFGDRGKGDWHLLKAMAEKTGLSGTGNRQNHVRRTRNQFHLCQGKRFLRETMELAEKLLGRSVHSIGNRKARQTPGKDAGHANG